MLEQVVIRKYESLFHAAGRNEYGPSAMERYGYEVGMDQMLWGDRLMWCKPLFQKNDAIVDDYGCCN